MKTRNIILIMLATAGILAVPLVAMQFTDEVVWTVADFVVAGILLAGTGLLYELAASRSDKIVYRAAAGVALSAALLLIWLNLAVGIIGTEDNPANLMYAGVFAVAFIGATIARLQPQGMARAMFATAIAQMAVGVIALIGGLDTPESGPLEILGLTGFFTVLWVASGVLFRRAGPRGSK